jgi:para-nitrobenzyl esterase
MPSLHLAEAQVAGGGRVHAYELAWAAPVLGGVLGACHGLDVPLVFGNLDVGQTAALIGTEAPAQARAMSERMQASWTAFAHDGDPGWPAYDTADRLVQVFDDESSVRPYPEEASRVIWQNYEFPALPLTRG